MPKPKLDLPPFPRLAWDGDWRGDFKAPFYKTENKPELVVRTQDPGEDDPEDGEPGPLPSAAQVAAFQRLVANDAPLRATLTAGLRKHVPRLAEADWPRIEEFLHLATVSICRTELEDESYLAFSLNQRDYRSGYDCGIGIFTHKDRVVHFGLAEEAWDEEAAIKDLRRRARSLAHDDANRRLEKSADAATENEAFDGWPELTWDGSRWESKLSLSWFNPRRKTELFVDGFASDSEDMSDEEPESPSAAQTAAFRRLSAKISTLPDALLARFREALPELAEATWDEVRRVLRMERATIFAVEQDGEAYVGLAFFSLVLRIADEHGIGIVLHRDRIVHMGFAEEAYEDEAAIDDRDGTERGEE